MLNWMTGELEMSLLAYFNSWREVPKNIGFEVEPSVDGVEDTTVLFEHITVKKFLCTRFHIFFHTNIIYVTL